LIDACSGILAKAGMVTGFKLAWRLFLHIAFVKLRQNLSDDMADAVWPINREGQWQAPRAFN
jgi:hypothetical protein